MNSNHIKSMLVLVFFMIFTVVSISTRFTQFQSVQKTEQTRDLQASSVSALMKAYTFAENEGGDIFATEQQRNQAVETFFINYTNCISASVDTDTYYYARYQVPAIALIDNDGYYIMYSKEVTGDDGKAKLVDVVSPEYSWEDIYGIYTIKYYLDSTIDVRIEGQSDIVRGNYKAVYDKLEKNGYDVGQLTFLKKYDDYKIQKVNVILASLQKNIEYTVNNHNKGFNSTDKTYSFVMPHIKNDIEDVLDGPCILAFSQNNQLSLTSDTLNSYALASADIVGKQYYYVTMDASTGEKTYHTKGCSHLASEEPFTIGTMKYCASHGAYPCTGCIH